MSSAMLELLNRGTLLRYIVEAQYSLYNKVSLCNECHLSFIKMYEKRPHYNVPFSPVSWENIVVSRLDFLTENSGQDI